MGSIVAKNEGSVLNGTARQQFGIITSWFAVQRDPVGSVYWTGCLMRNSTDFPVELVNSRDFDTPVIV